MVKGMCVFGQIEAFKMSMAIENENHNQYPAVSI